MTSSAWPGGTTKGSPACRRRRAPHTAVAPRRSLPLHRNATKKEIKAAYRRLAREWHPDKSSHPDAADIFMDIAEVGPWGCLA
jgi:DnaJ-domain-containing protein 1